MASLMLDVGAALPGLNQDLRHGLLEIVASVNQLHARRSVDEQEDGLHRILLLRLLDANKQRNDLDHTPRRYHVHQLQDNVQPEVEALHRHAHDRIGIQGELKAPLEHLREDVIFQIRCPCLLHAEVQCEEALITIPVHQLGVVETVPRAVRLRDCQNQREGEVQVTRGVEKAKSPTDATKRAGQEPQIFCSWVHNEYKR